MKHICDNSQCVTKADAYAMGKGAGDWGGYYCNSHIPSGFIITDRYEGN
jgi:hypothetical protein